MFIIIIVQNTNINLNVYLKNNDHIFFLGIVLLTVFSYLDDFSLWCVSKVCTRWEQLLRSHIPQSTWGRLAVECWPLYEPLKPIYDMHYVSSAM